MCRCTPEIRTPFCGKPGCESPSQTAAVIDILDARRAREPHLSGPARCLACHHDWEAVAPVGTSRLECPSCKTLRGVWSRPCGGAQGEPYWTCQCGCDLFMLTPRSLICTACAERKVGWYIGQDPSQPQPPPKGAA
jgi:hypothetical protein